MSSQVLTQAVLQMELEGHSHKQLEVGQQLVLPSGRDGRTECLSALLLSSIIFDTTTVIR